MSTEKSSSTDGRYSEICGATNNRGNPCKLPAGWGTPGSATRGRCKFHGGLSTGPNDTDHLEDNRYAEGNPGGGAPELNRNAEIHGVFADLQKLEARLDDRTREWVTTYTESLVEDTDADPALAEKKAGEAALLYIKNDRAWVDVFERGFGWIDTWEEEIDGETVTVTGEKANPALRESFRCSRKQRELLDEIGAFP